MSEYIVYRRVSTAEQGSSGLGLAAQQQAIEDYLSNSKGEIKGSFLDIQSGSQDNRDGLNKALRACRVHGASLIVSKLCRLSRSFSYAAKLLDGDTPIVVSENPLASMLELRLKAAINQEERERISTRTKEALAVKIEKGDEVGNPEIWKLAKNQSTEAATRKRSEKADDYKQHMKDIITSRFGNEMPSLSEVATWLDQEGYRTPKGNFFTRASVNRILKR